MRSRANRPPGVVQEQCQVEDEWIIQIFEDLAIRNQLRIVRPYERVELVDAEECMLVRGITMEKLVLHEAGQLPEFGDVAAQKIDPMHQTQRTSHLTLLR